MSHRTHKRRFESILRHTAPSSKFSMAQPMMIRKVNANVQECLLESNDSDSDPSSPSLQTISPITSWVFKLADHTFLRPTRRNNHSLKPLSYSDLHDVLDSAPCFPNRGGAERVALLFPVHEAPQLAVALLCALHRGCSVFPMDPRILTAGASNLSAAVGQMRCSMAVVSESLMGEVKDILSAKGIQLYSCSQRQQSEIGRLEWRQEFEGNIESPTADDEPTLLLNSSGTTGAPKVVPVRGSKLLYNAKLMAASMNLTNSDVALNAMPLFHIGGISCPLFGTLVSGGCLTQMDSAFDPNEFVELLQEFENGPTWFTAAPTLHRAILLSISAKGKKHVATRLRLVRSGAAHLPAQDAMALEEVFGCSVMPSYSMSESMPICSVPLGWRPSSSGKTDTVGFPIAPSLRIADPDTAAALPFGSVGEVMIRGPGVFDGYEGIDNEAAGAVVTSEDGKRWFRTGDLGRMDEEGFVFLQGRSKEVLKRGGEQVSLHEVDEALRRHPQVASAVAFGVPNEFWGEEVAAAVVLRAPGVCEEAILGEARRHLEPFKVPRQLVILASEHSLPKTAAGKVRRFELAAALKVEAIDNDAAAAIAQSSREPCALRPESEAPTEIVPTASAAKQCGPPQADMDEGASAGGQALYGLRLLLAFWVCQFHVGELPNEEWAKVQGFSLNMTGFMMLAGFLLANATVKAIRPEERRGFWVSRISAAHGCYLFALLYALPNHLYTNWDELDGRLAARLALNLSGMNSLSLLGPMVNGVLWFQAVYYQLVFIFPFIDGLYRAMSYRVLCAVTGTMFVLASLILRWVPIGLNFTILTWFYCFCGSVGMAHILRRGWAPLTAEQRRYWVSVWGMITDVLSAGWLVLAVVAAMTDEPGKTIETYRFTGRWWTELGRQIGWLRGGTIPFAVWVYGLAASSESTTARIFSNDFVVRRLSPLAMPIYMLHLPTAMYVYYLLNGGVVPEWARLAGAYQVDIEWYWLLVVFLLSALIGHVYNEYINPTVYPYVMAFVQFGFDVVLGVLTLGTSCLCPYPDPDEPLAGVDVEAGCGRDDGVGRTVLQTIRRLTGSTVEASSKLRSIGLDSFGSTALCGALRAALPAAANGLRPADLLHLESVGDLVLKLRSNLDPARGDLVITT